MAGRSTAVPAPADPAKFDAAMRSFRKRDPMTRKEWDKLDEAQREYAFMVSGVAQADMVAQVWQAVDRAIERGEDLADFKRQVGEMLETQWGGPDPVRVETIFRTNVNAAYNAGRHAVFSAPAVKEARPYFRFDTISDDRRDEECEELDGTVLPQDDPFWNAHTPPLHYNCFPSGTRVTTDRGSVPIDRLRPGNRVLSHDGRYHRVSNVLVSHHEGSLRVIRYVEKVLHVTANHPIAAQNRWVRADALNVSRDQVWVSKSTPSVADDPPSLADRERLKLGVGIGLGSRAVPFAPVEFDGQLGDGNAYVGVEGPDRQLRHVVHPKRPQRTRYLTLVGTAERALSRLRFFGQLVGGGLRTAARLVGCQHLLGASLVGHPLVAAGVVLGDRPRHAGGSQQPGYRRSATPKARRQGNRGLPPDVERDDLVLGQVEQLRHGFTLSSIDIAEQSYSGPVFNLEVDDTHTFVAEGVLVHNCRCTITALSPEEAEDEGIDRRAPDVDAMEGFGRRPSDVGDDWEPSTQDYPAAVGDILGDVLGR